MELIEQKLKTLTSYHGVIVNVRLDEARLPDGSTAKREVVEHPGGVTVLPLEADGTVWCVRQYRYPFSRTLLELPAGKLEPGEAPERAAARELSEETGLSAGRLQYLGANFPLGALVQMALDGELCDGKTTVALLKTQLLLARERGEAASGGL